MNYIVSCTTYKGEYKEFKFTDKQKAIDFYNVIKREGDTYTELEFKEVEITNDELRKQVLDDLIKYGKVKAVKMTRELTNWRLEQAMEYVNSLQKGGLNSD